MWHTRRWLSVSQMFLPHFDVFCDLLVNRRTTKWNPGIYLFWYNKATNYYCIGKQGYVFIFNWFWKAMFWCFIPDNNLYQQLFWDKAMVSYHKVNLKTNFVFGLVSLDCRRMSHFLKKKRLYCLLLASSACLMPRQDFFWIVSFAQSRKIIPQFPKHSDILKQRGKNFAVMMSIVRLSSKRKFI